MTSRPVRRSCWLLPAALSAACLTLAACSGGGGNVGGASSSPSAAGQTLTVAVSGRRSASTPRTRTTATACTRWSSAYEPLIWENDNGSLSPGLATSWQYVGTGNKTFELTIRKGAKFADGEPVTPQAVASSLNYFPKGSGPSTADLAGVTATASGADTVTADQQDARPGLPAAVLPGLPRRRHHQPEGAGEPQVADRDAVRGGRLRTRLDGHRRGEQYTFTPDPHYYDPARVHYKKIVIKVITQPTSELSALQTGQIDLMFGQSQQVSAAQSAGLQVKYSGAAAWDGVFLTGPDGQAGQAARQRAGPAGAELRGERARDRQRRVRRARQAHRPAGDATGWDEYVPSLASYYTYDVAKAKQLLAQAGYPHGFTMSLEYAALESQTQEMVQAFAQQMSAIGVTVNLKAEPTITALANDLSSSKYAAVSLEWGGQPMFLQVGECWLPTSVLNPFHADVRLHRASSTPRPAPRPLRSARTWPSWPP